MSERFKGKNNPAYNQVTSALKICGCGKQKSPSALQCRPCSFASGRRSGRGNGRYVRENREQYLAVIEAQTAARGIIGNWCAFTGIEKSRRKTVELLGYDFVTFKKEIESRFLCGMTWKNRGRGGWHVDHVIPITWFCWHGIYDPKCVNAIWNLRPMWETDNFIKGNKITQEALLLIHEKFPHLDPFPGTLKSQASSRRRDHRGHRCEGSERNGYTFPCANSDTYP